MHVYSNEMHINTVSKDSNLEVVTFLYTRIISGLWRFLKSAFNQAWFPVIEILHVHVRSCDVQIIFNFYHSAV